MMGKSFTSTLTQRKLSHYSEYVLTLTHEFQLIKIQCSVHTHQNELKPNLTFSLVVINHFAIFRL